jgi:SAM-dependent methyltransferase
VGNDMIRNSDSISCPVCCSGRVSRVIEIPQVPVYCNVLWETREEALQVRKGDILLRFCQDCGHLFNAAFNPGLMDYTRAYENSLHFSPRFQQYAETLAAELVKRHSLQGKKIVEIACGKGDFLRLICSLGSNRGFGFDPSYELGRHESVEDTNVTILQEYFGESPLPWTADLVCCRHALEHIHHPTDFLRGIHQAIGKKAATAVFFEVPNSLYTLRDLGIWDLIYEHCSYFWAGSLKRCFELAEFGVMEVRETFDDQFLCIDTSVFKEVRAQQLALSTDLLGLQDLVARFEEAYLQKIALWKERLNAFQKDGKRVVVWGGGSKGVTFLNVMKEAGEITYVVDLNPNKQGKFIPGTGQIVVSPENLSDYRPDVVILMNGIYRDEVLGELERLHLTSELLFA